MSGNLCQVTEVVYDPREDILVITLGTEKIIMMDNQGQVRRLRWEGLTISLFRSSTVSR